MLQVGVDETKKMGRPVKSSRPDRQNEDRPPDFLGEPMKWASHRIREDWSKLKAARRAIIPILIMAAVISWLAVWQIVVPHKDAIIANLKEEKDRDRSQMASMTGEIERLRQDKEQLAKKVESYASDGWSPTWSHISKSDADYIKEALKRCDKRSVSFLVTTTSEDARIFYEQVEGLFKEAGFPVTGSWGLAIGIEHKLVISPQPEAFGEPMATIIRKIAAASNRKVEFGGPAGVPAKPTDVLSFQLGTR